MKPDPEIIQRWKKILSVDEIHSIETAFSEEMRILEYEPYTDTGRTDGAISPVGLLKDLMIPVRYLLNGRNKSSSQYSDTICYAYF